MPEMQSKQWDREAVKAFFEDEVYGRFPKYDVKQTSFKIVNEELREDHILREIEVELGLDGSAFRYRFELYLPLGEADRSYGCFLFLNREDWMELHRIDGELDGYFPLQKIIGQGFTLANLNVLQACADSYEDYVDKTQGLRPHLGQDLNDPHRLACIGLWSFLAMRTLDVLVALPEVDTAKLAVIGLSRLGKTALLTGAFDERVAATIPINSGCGGAALSKSKIGEQIADITRGFPHWFTARFSTYAEDSSQLKMDQDSLLALVAPRLLYVSSSEDDDWADPASEYESCRLASKIYQSAYGVAGLESPEAEVETGRHYHTGQIAYHMRTGEHGLKWEDWEAVMGFAKKKGW